jgi:poly(3-hydroxybutyrate) depolymerase
LTATGGKAASGGTSASSSASGGSSGSGGTTTAGGAAGTGGVVGSGGTPAGSGGLTGSGGKASGGTAAGGSTGGGGAAPGGSTGSGGSGVDGGAGNGGAATASAGCGKTDGAKTLTAGGSSVSGAPTTSTRLKGVTSGGKTRDVIIDIPADYDPTKPYRLIFSWRQMYGSDTGNATGQTPAFPGSNFDAEHYAYFGLRRESLDAKDPAIFVAPDTDPIGGNWDYDKDSVYFDDLLALVSANLCIDQSRVFTTGFSFGAMFSYGLSNGRASKLRAAVTMAPSQFGPTTGTTPIAYMSTTGMSDPRCVWGDANSGGEGCVIQHAKVNGCTIPATFPTATIGSKRYVCYDFEGCKAGYPVKVCTFDGQHTPAIVDDGTNGGDDGLKAFIPPLAWQFISQF